MHFKLTHQLPEKCIVACSGGPDSVAALYWLHRSKKVEEIIYVHHNTGDFADDSQRVVMGHASSLGIPCTLHRLSDVPRGQNREQWWRDQRYGLFASHPTDLPVVIAHHLDDCVEEYVVSALVKGYTATIPYRHGRCIRPFRTCTKHDMLLYCIQNMLRYTDDPTNNQTSNRRGMLRQKLIPFIKDNLNEGISSMVRRMIEEGLGDNDVATERAQNPNRWGANFTASLELEES